MTTLLITIALALVGAAVSFVGIMLTKEQKVSEFRLDWIEHLRADIASLAAHALSIHAVYVKSDGPPALNTTHEAKVMQDFLEANKVSIRIRLRLNPTKESHMPVIRLLGEIERLFAQGIENIPFEQIDELVARITTASQKLLRSVWEEVKRGETTFRVTKWLALGVAIAALALLIIGMALQVRDTERREPLNSLHEKHFLPI